MNRPNVVMIVLDDLGFSDLGCYGSDIDTPNIDRIANEGLRYVGFNVTGVCSPTRACLLTGRNHHAVGMGLFPDMPMGHPGYTGRISKSAAMLPRLLRGAGYSTFAVGKWHLTPGVESNAAGPFDRWPLGVGFDRYYGFLHGMTNQWTPDLVSDNELISPPRAPEDGYHLTDDLASRAIRLIQRQQEAAPERPFFLYFAPGAVHWPHHAPQPFVERYKGVFDEGWDVRRTRTFAKQLELALVPPETTLTSRPSWVADWDGLAVAERRVFARMMEAYAGFVTHTDAHIGRLLDFLGELGLRDDTLVMLCSDNGASAEGGPQGAFNLVALNDTETDRIEAMLDDLDEFGGLRANNHYAWGWAWAGNTPFRLWKRYAWLGGVRTPLVVHWPAGIPEHAAGGVRPQFCHAIDVMPTILEAVGIEAPDVVDGVLQTPLDGRSLLSTFETVHAPAPRGTQYFEVLGSRAIYHDGWKATTDYVDDHLQIERKLLHGSHRPEDDRWALFCLDEDFSEAKDLSGDHPSRLQRLTELWWVEAGRNDVLPLMDASERFRSTASAGPRRSTLIYRPGGGPIAAPSPFVGASRISAEIDVPESGAAAGVICAQGDWHNGWAIYLLDGVAVAAFNLGGRIQRLVASGPIGAGRHDLQLEFEPCPRGDVASASLAIDGIEMTAATVSGSRGLRAQLGYSRLLVGRDDGFPVCGDYQPPFPFTGTLDRLVLELATHTPASSAHERLARVLRRD